MASASSTTTRRSAGTELLGRPVLGDRSLLPELADDPEMRFSNNVMGDLDQRAAVADLLDDHGCRIASLVDPGMDVLDLEHGRGVFIGAFANFGASARLGDHTVIMQAVVLGDDTRVGDYAFIATGAAIGSRCVIGDGTFVGPNSVTSIDRKVGTGCVIGAGAIITKDVPDGARMLNRADARSRLRSERTTHLLRGRGSNPRQFG